MTVPLPEQDSVELLRALTQVSHAVSNALSLDEILDLASEQASLLLGAERSLVLLTDDDGELRIRAQHGLDDPPAESLTGALHETLMSKLATVLGESSAERVLAVPLVVRGHVTGLFAVGPLQGIKPSGPREAILTALADQMAAPLENARLAEEVREAHLDATSALRAAGVGTVERDLSSDPPICSEETYRLIGLAPGTRLKADSWVETWLAVVHPDDRARVQALSSGWKNVTTAAAGEPQNDVVEIEYRVVLPDGGVRWLTSRVRVIFGTDGRAARIRGVVFDVTERKRAEEALRRISTRVELALRGSDIGIWELELPDGVLEHGRVIFTNVWEQLGYGYPESGAGFEAAINLSHPDDRERQKECFRAYLAGDTRQLEFEHRLRHRDGSYRTVLVRGVAVRDAAGKPTRVIGSRVDITDRKRSEQALRDSEERLRLATDVLAGFLYDADLTTNRVAFDRGLDRVLGFLPAEAPPDLTWWGHRVHPDDRAHGSEEWQAAVDGDASGYVLEYRVRHRDGHYVDVVDRGRIIRDDSGRALRVVGGTTDVSERRRLERERAALLEREHEARLAAEAAARARDVVLGVVSHDLRSPLSSIAMCASALLQNADTPPETVRRILEAIHHAAESTSRLIRDLMDVASIEAGRLALEPREEAPATILQQAVELFAAAALDRGVALQTSVEADLPPVRADAERVIQGLGNLVANALKFTGPGGRIILHAERDPEGVRFGVDDTGVGIANGDLPHVFDRYWQKGHGGERGAGLGLAIVRGIVDAHGGHVGVESTPGKGSHFSFTIPTAN
jgi:PAS domain S-box-containing protein